MSTKVHPTDLPMHSFLTAKEFETFLERQHETMPGFYLKVAKKSSNEPSISAEEAIEVALCFGWIDGWGMGLGEDWYSKRFTPRRSKSLWSQKNVATASRLLEEGRVRPAGIAAIEAAKADGRWDRAYGGANTSTVPDDFAVALAGEPTAQTFFDTLNKSRRYSVLWQLQTCAPQNRAKKIETLVQMLTEAKVPGDASKLAAKTKRSAGVEKISKKKSVVNAKSQRNLAGKASSVQIEQPHQPRRAGLRPRP